MRLIDANALKEDLEISKYIIPNNLNKLLNSEINRCIEAIDNAPTVELFCHYQYDGEVKEPCLESPCKYETIKGEWKMDSIGAYCSNCHTHPDYTTNFCSYCGADMRGKEK